MRPVRSISHVPTFLNPHAEWATTGENGGATVGCHGEPFCRSPFFGFSLGERVWLTLTRGNQLAQLTIYSKTISEPFRERSKETDGQVLLDRIEIAQLVMDRDASISGEDIQGVDFTGRPLDL